MLECFFEALVFAEFVDLLSGEELIVYHSAAVRVIIVSQEYLAQVIHLLIKSDFSLLYFSSNITKLTMLLNKLGMHPGKLILCGKEWHFRNSKRRTSRY